MRLIPPTPDGIAIAAEAIRNGAVVAYPTETVYGLGADPFSERAIERLYEVKARDTSNPVLLIAADDDQVRSVVGEISPIARRFMEAFWPGPLSLVLPRSPELPASLCGSGSTICVRQTSSSTAANLCRAFGGAITSTSANRSGDPPARTAHEVELEGVALVIDGGCLEREVLPSTVFDPNSRIVYREGAITRDMLMRVAGV